MLVKTTIMLQPQTYYAHIMLMNIITHAPIHSGDLVVITKWLSVQEVVVTTVILLNLANSQAVPRQGNARSEKPRTSTKKHISKQEQPNGS